MSRVLMEILAGVIGADVPPGGSEGSNVLHGAINAMGDVVEIAKATAEGA